MATGNGMTVVGSTAAGSSVYEPWPNYWTWPTYPTYVYPTYIGGTSPDDYANEVEVDRGEHDAVLRFYRTKGASRSLVKEITVPLGVLGWLSGEGN